MSALTAFLDGRASSFGGLCSQAKSLRAAISLFNYQSGEFKETVRNLEIDG
jgi:hypothetical protein